MKMILKHLNLTMMSKKLLANRLSKIVAPDALSKVRQAILSLHDILGADIAISDEDYKSLAKIADTRKRITDDVFNIIKENQDLLDAPLSIEEIEKDKLYYELCDDIRGLLSSFVLKLDKEQNIAGAQYYNACSVFEDDIATKVGRNNAKAQNVQSQLDGIDRKRGGGGKKEVPPKQ
jgi:argonaute-like protein implicated in RNA metabolism and viral defense